MVISISWSPKEDWCPRIVHLIIGYCSGAFQVLDVRFLAQPVQGAFKMITITSIQLIKTRAVDMAAFLIPHVMKHSFFRVRRC